MAEEHPDWPDATRSLLRVPELESIERDARGLLSRALNGGRVIGFVGAGTSMAYGRLSWRDLVRIKQEQVLEEAEKYNSDSSVRDLKTLLEQQQIKADGTSEPDAFLPAMQLTEQLQDLMDRFDRKQEPLFRQDIAKMVGDDNGQLHHILSIGLKGLKDVPSKDVPSVEELKEGKLPRVRQADLIRDLCNRVEKGNHSNTSILSFVKEVRSLVPDERLLTRPYHRFVISILLSLLTGKKEKEDWLKEERAKSGGPEPNLRADLIPEERDPLRLMRKLQISRFLTTNYDSEAERLLGEEGLVNLTKGQANDLVHHERDDPLAPGSRDFIFDKEHTGELFAFAAHTRRREATVVHLHGRAENPESLIVTEGDYQRHYLAAHGNRGLMEDSLRAAFTSSPLLFVGSGVGEDDLVRPLRQFVRDPVMGEGRVAIALVPMWYADQKKEQGTAIRNLQRYGVHTVHYGYVTSNPETPQKEDRWLGPFLEYSRDISRVIEGLAKSSPEPNIREAKVKLTELIKKIDDLPGGTDPKTIEGVKVAFYPGLAIRDEINLLKTLVHLVQGEYTRLEKKDEVEQDVAFKAAIDLCLNGIQDAITGAFLCARLIRVRQDWSEWRSKWLGVTTPEEPSRAIERWWSDLPPQLEQGGQPATDGCQPAPHFKTPFRRHHVRLPQAFDIRAVQDWFAKNPGGRIYDGAKSTTDFGPLTESEKRTLFRQKHRLLRQRFDARAYSPTFLSLHKAMERSSHCLQNLPVGRRIFLLVAHSGVGKGHFTTALAEEEYLKVFQKDLGDPHASNPTMRWPAAMFNLSFSHEVSSTFDQLAAFLQDCGKALGGGHFKPISDLADRLKGDRLNCLDALL